MRVTWLTKDNLIQGPNGRPTSGMASVRYRCLLPAEYLAQQKIDITIISHNPHAKATPGQIIESHPDLLVVGKFHDADTLHLVRHAKKAGIRIIADFCDNYFDNPKTGPFYRELSDFADTIISSTPQMAAIIRDRTGKESRTISDPFEGQRCAPRLPTQNNSLRLLWFGNQPNLVTLAPAIAELQTFSQKHAVDLTIISNDTPHTQSWFEEQKNLCPPSLRLHFKPWSLAIMPQALRDADAVIIPSLANDFQTAKSPNRVIESLWAGLPVVAYPIPSYLEFDAYTFLDTSIASGLHRLLGEKPENTQRMIENGQRHIQSHYTPEIIGNYWHMALAETLAAPFHPYEEKMQPAFSGLLTPDASGKVRLNIGCGDKVLPGFVNIDIVDERAGKKPDIQCDIRRLTLPDNVADEAMAIHVIEHFYYWEAADVIKEWVRVLKPGGQLILECPNLITACTELLQNPNEGSLPDSRGQRTMWVFYGDPKWKDPLMCHKWAYTPLSLGALMHQCGLVNIRQEPAQYKLKEPRDMRIVGEKAA
jgi:glycosyltransferase involved in cell wall biosynthesis